MLTLKTKEKFEEWLIPELRKLDYVDETYSNEELIDGFYKLPLVCQQALVVEFFDSVGIVITPTHNYIKETFGWMIKTNAGDYIGNGFDTRPEALSKAIEKANEIFNLKNE